MPIKQSGSIADGAPLIKAHEHAALADDLHSRGDLQGAIIEHSKAAQEYLNSVEYTEDTNLQATLRRMHTEQTKLAEDLKRRLTIQERENRASGSRAPRKPFTYPPQDDSGPPSRVPSQSHLSSMALARLQDSSVSDKTAGGESFMVLGDWSEAGERFNRFWGNVEGLLEKFSQPVAFATAPLTPWEQSDSGSGDTDYEDASPVMVKKQPAPPVTKNKPKAHTKQKSSHSPKVISLDFEDDSSDYDSFYLVPSSHPPTRNATVVPAKAGPSNADLLRMKEEENKKLKAELEAVRTKLAKADNIIKIRAGQEAQLRDSIMIAKREAQRHLVGSTTFRNLGLTSQLSTAPQLHPSGPPPADAAPSPLAQTPNHGASSPVTVQQSPSQPTIALQKRVKDLEEELRLVKVENEKQKAQISRFRDKWQNLKESARRKRSQKEVANMGALSIKEEDEDDVAIRETAAAAISIVPHIPGQYNQAGGDSTPRGSINDASSLD